MLSSSLNKTFTSILLQIQPTSRKNTTNIDCKGELGRHPLIIEINNEIASYWAHLETITKECILLYDAIHYSKQLDKNNKNSFYNHVNNTFIKQY